METSQQQQRVCVDVVVNLLLHQALVAVEPFQVNSFLLRQFCIEFREGLLGLIFPVQERENLVQNIWQDVPVGVLLCGFLLPPS